MSKLLEDPKIAALVEKEATRAVKADRKRAAEQIKALRATAADEIEDKASLKAVNKTIAVTNKILRDAEPELDGVY